MSTLRLTWIFIHIQFAHSFDLKRTWDEASTSTTHQYEAPPVHREYDAWAKNTGRSQRRVEEFNIGSAQEEAEVFVSNMLLFSLLVKRRKLTLTIEPVIFSYCRRSAATRVTPSG